MPALPRTIAFHIGAHKTATTHLQKTLHENRSLLKREGITYLGPAYLRQQGYAIDELFALSHSTSPQPRRGPRRQLKFLAKGSWRLVFSEENFIGMIRDARGRVILPLYPNAATRLSELAALWDPIKPQVFLSVRNPTGFMNSVYSQVLYAGSYQTPADFRARNDWRDVDWVDLVGRLRVADGIGDIYVWRHEDYAQVCRLVLRRMLRWRVGRQMEIPDELVHEGLTVAGVKHVLEWAAQGRSGDLGHDARDAFPRSPEDPPFTLYDADEQVHARTIYDAQIARIGAMEGVKLLVPDMSF